MYLELYSAMTRNSLSRIALFCFFFPLQKLIYTLLVQYNSMADSHILRHFTLKSDYYF